MSDTAIDAEVSHAEILLPAPDLDLTVRFFVEQLGFRLEGIMPADEPRLALLCGHGLQLRLDSQYQADPCTLLIGSTTPVPPTLWAPNETRIVFGPPRPPMCVPALQPTLHVERVDHAAAWKTGRAGMRYRDLIPDRLGGAVIASHICIPDGGPVPDNVHYHDVAWQLIYCHRGWVKLVYEDQGKPFVMHAGDCVLQPPGIRHRVLEASDGLEVIEVGSPAEHMTWLDHDLSLPTAHFLPQRDFSGQTFAFSQSRHACWIDDLEAGTSSRDLEMGVASAGAIGARILRCASTHSMARVDATTTGAFGLGFVLQGSMDLGTATERYAGLHAGDAFLIPPGAPQVFERCSADWSLLQVYAPA